MDRKKSGSFLVPFRLLLSCGFWPGTWGGFPEIYLVDVSAAAMAGAEAPKKQMFIAAALRKRRRVSCTLDAAAPSSEDFVGRSSVSSNRSKTRCEGLENKKLENGLGVQASTAGSTAKTRHISNTSIVASADHCFLTAIMILTMMMIMMG